jgi:hypothetical protein
MFARLPSVETLGYFRVPLRGKNPEMHDHAKARRYSCCGYANLFC